MQVSAVSDTAKENLLDRHCNRWPSKRSNHTFAPASDALAHCSCRLRWPPALASDRPELPLIPSPVGVLAGVLQPHPTSLRILFRWTPNPIKICKATSFCPFFLASFSLPLGLAQTSDCTMPLLTPPLAFLLSPLASLQRLRISTAFCPTRLKPNPNHSQVRNRFALNSSIDFSRFFIEYWLWPSSYPFVEFFLGQFRACIKSRKNALLSSPSLLSHVQAESALAVWGLAFS